MTLWLDANLSPAIARWIAEHVNDADAHSAWKLGLLHATDEEFFAAAREAGVVLLTKDKDFVQLVTRHGSPPQVVWYRGGNGSNQQIIAALQRHLPAALDLIRQGEHLVEIRSA